MDKELESYLTTVEKYLKNMPASERIDIIKELKSYIEELQVNNTLSAKDILQKLDSPKELAAGYLGDKITMGSSFNLKKVLMVFSFYSLTALSGMFVIPCGTVFAGGLMICSIVAPIAAAIKLLGFFLGFEVPFVMFQFGSYELHPLLTLPITIVLSILFFLLGRLTWKAVIGYIRKTSNVKRKLNVM